MELLKRPLAEDPYVLLPQTLPFTLISPDIADGETMADLHIAAHDNLSPELTWSGFPAETQSFVVNCFDPDAPTPAGYWHWSVVDIPATVTSLAQGAGDVSGAKLPTGAYQVRNDAGDLGYMGAAPPKGDRPHRYVFAVHALNVANLGVNADSTPTTVAFNALFATIARATLTPIYQN